MPRPPITRARPYTPTHGKLAGRTFHSERQYRNALAQQRGYTSFRQQQRSAKIVRTRAQYRALRPSEREARDRALDAIARHRREGISLAQATREAHTTTAAVKRYGGTYVSKGKGGRLEVSANDRLYRRMKFLTPDGTMEIDVYSSRAASRLGEYWAAVKHYVETGQDGPLRAFRGKSIRTGKTTYHFVTDLETINHLAHAGELSFESIYES